MFIAIEHEIRDATKFQECAQRAFPPPAGLRVHQFLPAADLTRAFCPYEGASVEAVRSYVDGALEDASTQRYFPVAEEQAVGPALIAVQLISSLPDLPACKRERRNSK